MKLFFLALSLFVVVLTSSVSARAESESQFPPVEAGLPLLDLPFNQSSYFPNLFSMHQSLVLSTDYYEIAHSLIGGSPESDRRRIWWVAGFDFLSEYLPLGSSWMHEEWHRSVMSRRGIGSFDDVNLLPFGQSLIAVSHVDDQDLVELKRDHPAEQVRLSSAGMESQIVQNNFIESHHFFKNQRTKDQVLLWMNALNVSFYLNECSTENADSSTDEQNQSDGVDISRRDFTGLDCTAWVYDLFRPDEAYTARGTHPSGVGIDRYIRYSDLNEKEIDFLKLQTKLSLLNFVDPFLFGKNEFDGEMGSWRFQWNAKLSHYLTSFGAVVDVNLFLKTDPSSNYLFVWHNGMTDSRYLPGMTFEKLDATLNSLWKYSAGFTIWPQPRDQRIEDTSTEWLLAGLYRISYQWKDRFRPYFEVEAKTPGWLAGNVYLDRNVSVRAGFTALIF